MVLSLQKTALLGMDTEASILEDGKILETDRGGGCLKPLNCILKNILNGKFYIMYMLAQ